VLDVRAQIAGAAVRRASRGVWLGLTGSPRLFANGFEAP
jgi:hypothetical protein